MVVNAQASAGYAAEIKRDGKKASTTVTATSIRLYNKIIPHIVIMLRNHNHHSAMSIRDNQGQLRP